MSDVVLVGEDNPYGADPEFALYCYPPGCSGYRLRRILGIPQHQYLALDRVNLCVGSWSKVSARSRAKELLAAVPSWRVMVLLGRKVAETFEHIALGGAPLVPFATRTIAGTTLVSLPHPSGRNTVWNHSAARGRARQILRDVVPEVAWGSGDGEPQEDLA